MNPMSNYQKRTLYETTLMSLKSAHNTVEPTNPALKAHLFGLIQRRTAALENVNDEIAIQERKRETELAELNATMEAITVYSARYNNDLFNWAMVGIANAFEMSVEALEYHTDSDAFQTVRLMVDSAEFYCGVQCRANAPVELLKRMIERPAMQPAVSKFLALFL